MKRQLTIILALSLCATCYADTAALKAVWDATPVKYANTFLRDIRRVPQIQETTVVTNVVEVPATLQVLSTRYKVLLEQYFGTGAATNENVTYDTVRMYFLTRNSTNNIAAADGSKLVAMFSYLSASGLTATPADTWSYPYGATAITNITTNTVYTQGVSVMEANGVSWRTKWDMFDAFNALGAEE